MLAEADPYCFVIERDDNIARHDNARVLMEACGLSPERWPRVTVSDLPDGNPWFFAASEPLFDPVYPAALSADEIYQLLTFHSILSEQIRDGIEVVLIFEDHMNIDREAFVLALQLAMRHIAKVGLIALPTQEPQDKRHLLDRIGSTTLLTPETFPDRPIALLVGLEAARKLHRQTRVFDRPLTALLQSYWQIELWPGVLWPSGVSAVESDPAHEAQDPAAPKSLRERWRIWTYQRDLARMVHGAQQLRPIPEDLD